MKQAISRVTVMDIKSGRVRVFNSIASLSRMLNGSGQSDRRTTISRRLNSTGTIVTDSIFAMAGKVSTDAIADAYRRHEMSVEPK